MHVRAVSVVRSMNYVAARFFGSRDAAPEAACIEWWAGRLCLRSPNLATPLAIDAAYLQGNHNKTPRVLRFPQGARCEVDDSQGLKTLLDQQKSHSRKRFQGFAQSIKILGLSLICLLILALASYQLLKPSIADYLAARIPAHWIRSASESALAQLDQTWLHESQLPPMRRDAIRAYFAAMRAPAEGAPPYQLLFRDSQQLGASVFSLPGGQIVISDSFINQSQDDREILALLAQQLGELQGNTRFGEALSESMLSVIKATYFDDIDHGSHVLADKLLNLPPNPKHAGAADRYATTMLRINGIDAIWLAAALQRKASAQSQSRSAIVPALLRPDSNTQNRIDAILGNSIEGQDTQP